MRAMQGLAGLVLAGCAVNSAAPPGATTVAAVARSGVAAPLAQGETQLVVRTVPAGDAAAGAPRRRLPGRDGLVHGRLREPGAAADARLRGLGAGRDGDLPVGRADRQGAASPQAAWSGGLGGWPAVGISVGTGSADGRRRRLGLVRRRRSAPPSGVPVTRYPELRVEMR